MSTCLWPLGNGESIEFSVHDSNTNWNPLAGLYIFCYQVQSGGWIPLYIGQTDDFSTRLPNHERLDEAIQRGATHLHAAVIPLKANRDKFEKILIQHLQPVMNDQLKGFGAAALLHS